MPNLRYQTQFPQLRRLLISFFGFFCLHTNDTSKLDLVSTLSTLPSFKNLHANYSLEFDYLVNRQPYDHPPDFLLSPPSDICTNAAVERAPDGQPLLLVLSNSPVGDFKGRELLRSRWGAMGGSSATPLAFLLGIPKNEEMKREIIEEAKEFSDLIVFDAEDTYYNIGAKTTGFLRFAHEFCPTANYVARWDGDDTPVDFVRVRRMLRERIASGVAEVASLGHCSNGLDVLRYGKYKMPVTYWPFRMYPPNPVGPFALFPRQVVNKLANVRIGVKNSEMLFSDIAVGMLGLAAGVPCETIKGMYFWTKGLEGVLKEDCSKVLAIHPLIVNETGFDLLSNYFEKCATEAVLAAA